MTIGIVILGIVIALGSISAGIGTLVLGFGCLVKIFAWGQKSFTQLKSVLASLIPQSPSFIITLLAHPVTWAIAAATVLGAVVLA
jgi:hypothetical protein